jgi:hypothetical protein
VEREGSLWESFCGLANQKRLSCDVTVEAHHQEVGVSIGISCLAYCYGYQATQWKMMEEGAPALCGILLN